MPTLVHLTPERNAASILRAGIKSARAGTGRPAGVYCMPVLPRFFIMHQWLRELKRWKADRMIVGIIFRLPSDEPVWVGHYQQEHLQLPLSEAIHVIRQREDARGYQIFVPRAVAASEVLGVRHLPQVVGWRYRPDAHGQPPCSCPVCLPKGQYGSASLRARLDPPIQRPAKAVLLARLAAAKADAAIEDVLWDLRAQWRGGGEELAFLVSSPSPRTRALLALALGAYRGPVARRLLRRLVEDPDAAVREEAQLSLEESTRSWRRSPASPRVRHLTGTGGPSAPRAGQ